MCSFASRDPVNISSTIQHNSKTNDCVCVFERERDRRGREREREREKGRRGGRGKREEFALSYVSHCCGCTFTVGLIKGSSLFDACNWSVVCFIGSDCLCVKVCRLTTVVVLVIVNYQVKYLKGPTQVLSLSLSVSI